MFGEPDVERLWEAVATATRLDEDDPVAAWRAHIAKLGERVRPARRAALRRDPVPRPGHRPHRRADAASRAGTSGSELTATGVEMVVNMPTEEVFTTPHRLRTEGVVRSTMPLVVNGQIVRDLSVRFSAGASSR